MSPANEPLAGTLRPALVRQLDRCVPALTVPAIELA
jgi:hypothetical protein